MATLTSAARPRSLVAARTPARRWVPCLPTLWPGMLRPRLSPLAGPFPFSAPVTRRYYFARNAVYHGVRQLGLAGWEMLVPAYHHGVEVEALVAAGVVPRFVRVDGRMRLDVDALEAAVGPRTRAIYVIHYAGFPQPMDAVLELARRRGLVVIEDCALALFSHDGPVPLGARGDAGVFCLYKSVPVPNGGMLVLNRPAELPREAVAAPVVSTLHHVGGSLVANAAFRGGEPAQLARDGIRAALRLFRRTTGVQHVSTGTMHFDPSDADLGMSPISDLVLRNCDPARIVAARRRNYFLLLGRLRDAAPPIFGELPSGVCPLFYPFVTEDKSGLKARLEARGIETVDFWRVGHAACPDHLFPEVANLRRRVLELPCHQDLEPEDMAYVARCVEECL